MQDKYAFITWMKDGLQSLNTLRHQYSVKLKKILTRRNVTQAKGTIESSNLKHSSSIIFLNKQNMSF